MMSCQTPQRHQQARFQQKHCSAPTSSPTNQPLQTFTTLEPLNWKAATARRNFPPSHTSAQQGKKKVVAAPTTTTSTPRSPRQNEFNYSRFRILAEALTSPINMSFRGGGRGGGFGGRGGGRGGGMLAFFDLEPLGQNADKL